MCKICQEFTFCIPSRTECHKFTSCSVIAHCACTHRNDTIFIIQFIVIQVLNSDSCPEYSSFASNWFHSTIVCANFRCNLLCILSAINDEIQRKCISRNKKYPTAWDEEYMTFVNYQTLITDATPEYNSRTHSTTIRYFCVGSRATKLSWIAPLFSRCHLNCF